MVIIPTINMVRTGQNIMKLRDENRMSVKDLQDIFGFATPQAIYKWQHGTALPSVDNLVILAAVFHALIEDILVIDENINIQVSACKELRNRFKLQICYGSLV